MSYPIYIILGLTPSIIWLLFFLRKDSHPESNKMILKIFVYGILIAAIAAVIEISIFWVMAKFNDKILEIPKLLKIIIYHFIGIALVEEYLKYLVVREKVLKDSEFDEPVDAMLYMIITALGFAALENVLVLFPIGRPFLETASISIFRFIGATLLHALCSGAIGYFLALSLLRSGKRYRLILKGILIAVLLHGFYNLSIIKIATNANYIFVPILILIGLALFVSAGFKELKKTRSICLIKK